MDRLEFLQMCQKCSVLNFINITDDLLVLSDDIKYIPYGYEMKFKDGNPIHSAILRDTKANSVTYTNLARVDKYLKI